MSFDIELDKFKAGDRQTFDQVYQYYARRIQYFAFSFLRDKSMAEDVTHESLAKLWSGRGRIQSIDQISAFLYIATKNACLDLIRAKQRHPRIPLEGLDLGQEEASTLARIIHAELLQQIENEVNKLPDSQKTVFRLSVLEGLTTEEIVAKTGMSRQSIFSQKSKAVGTLRKLLKDNLLFLILIAYS